MPRSAGRSSPRPSTRSGACSRSRRSTSSARRTRSRPSFVARSRRWRPDRVDVGGVADAELHVHRSGRTDHRGHLVEAHEAALVVRHLHVDVERRRTGCAQLAELGGERSVETLIVDAPSPSSARAVGAFAHGRSTEVLSTSVCGSSPSCFIWPSVARTPASATSTERMPSPTARRTSAIDQSTPAWPRATPPTAPVAKTDRPRPTRRAARGRAIPRPRARHRATPCPRSPSRSASSRPIPARPYAPEQRAPRPPRARLGGPSAPRRRGFRSGTSGRRRSARRSPAHSLALAG